MQKSEKEKLVQKLRRAADAQRKAYSGNVYHDGIAQGLDNAAGIIGKVRCEEPTADAVEVVRCKDCKHWTDKNGGLCDIWVHYISNEEFFCGCGERREADGDDQ